MGGFNATRGGVASYPEGSTHSVLRTSLEKNYPDISYSAFSELTTNALTNVDILIMTSVKVGLEYVSLSAGEQTVLSDFVENGNCAVLVTDNSSYVHQTFVAPFGMTTAGTINGTTNATVDKPQFNPLTNGRFGSVPQFSQWYPGRISSLGPYAESLANNTLGTALAVIAKGKISSGSGPVIVYSDYNTFDDTRYPQNEILFLNTIDYCLNNSNLPPVQEFRGPAGDYSKLVRNGDSTYTRRLKDGTLIQFNSTGQQTAVTDRNGNTTGYGYDGQGRLTSITDPTGQIITLNYNNGLLNAVSYPDGRVTNFTHTGSDLTGVLYPDGAAQSFGYDGRHLMTSETDRRGLVRTRQFDLYGRVTQAALPDGSTRQTSASQKIGLIDLNSGVGTEANPAPVVRPNQALSNLLDGEGRMMVFSTGPVNRFASIKDAANLTTTYTRDENGNVTKLSRPSGAIYDQTYDASGNLTSAINRTFSNNPTRFTYEGTYNQITSITDPLNQSPTRFTYDAKGNLTQLTSPLNRTVTMEYDSRGMVTRLVDPLTTPTTFSYNPSGNLNQIIQNPGPTQRTTNFNYTPEGYVDTLTDALSRPYNYDYDDAGRILTETLPGPRIISYNYDGAGNLTSLTPPGRPAHSFVYNNTGLPASYNAPPVAGGGSNRTDYSYNLAQQLTQITRPDNQTLAINYDTAGRLSRLTFPRGQLNYTYNPTSGYLTGLTAPENVTLQYSYDRDKLTGVTWSGPVNGIVGYTYDGKGRVTRLSTASNNLNFTYDADDMVTQAGNLSLTYATQSGLLQSTTLANIRDAWNFNPFAELSVYSATVSGSALYSLQYNHDNLGRIVTKTETISGVTSVYGYRYDPAGRLDRVLTNGAATESYTYDANGNRLTALGISAAGYDDQDRLLSYGNTSYSYNPNGELQSKTSGGLTTSYNYDALGNLITVTLPTLPTSTQITYLVDGQNRRIGKRINGVLTQTWLYQDDLRPIAELNGSGGLVSLFVYASKGNVPDYMIRGGVNYRLLSDHLGSVRLVVNSSTGQIAQRLDYDAFGRVLADTNPGFQPFGFAGGLYDPDTRLVRFGARDYDAEVGRWTTKDPIGFAGGDTNLYGYVGGDPVNEIDLSGLESYQCRRPLGERNPSNEQRNVLDHWINPSRHDYYCVIRNGDVTCGSQAPSGSTLGSPGRPTTPEDGDIYSPKLCEKISPPNGDCVDSCLLRKNKLSRPYYSIGPFGTDCQEWTSNTIKSCQRICVGLETATDILNIEE